MKQCPICGAMSFDDAPVCYGCLFDYAKQGQGVLKGIDADQKVGVVSAPSVSQPGSGLFAEGEHAWGEALVFRMAASAPRSYSVEACSDGSLRLTFAPGWSCSVIEGESV